MKNLSTKTYKVTRNLHEGRHVTIFIPTSKTVNNQQLWQELTDGLLSDRLWTINEIQSIFQRNKEFAGYYEISNPKDVYEDILKDVAELSKEYRYRAEKIKSTHEDLYKELIGRLKAYGQVSSLIWDKAYKCSN